MMFYNTAFLASKLEIGIMGTLSGMLMVFLALILISIIISFFKYIGGDSKKAKPSVPEAKVEPVVAETLPEEELTDDLELVAVITAALAASMNTSSDQLVVRSLRRVNAQRSAWGAKGRSDNLRNSY